MQALILFSCLVAAASAWNCPQLPVVESLNVTLLAGTWYQQSLAGVASFTQPGATCAKEVYTVDSTGQSLFTFENSQKVLFSTVETKGSANWADPNNQNGKLIATVPAVLVDLSTDLWVLDTDYENFLILYSCRKVLNVPGQASWILTRKQNPQDVEKAEIDVLIANAFVNIKKTGGPDIEDFVATKQDDCEA